MPVEEMPSMSGFWTGLSSARAARMVREASAQIVMSDIL